MSKNLKFLVGGVKKRYSARYLPSEFLKDNISVPTRIQIMDDEVVISALPTECFKEDIPYFYQKEGIDKFYPIGHIENFDFLKSLGVDKEYSSLEDILKVCDISKNIKCTLTEIFHGEYIGYVGEVLVD